MAVVAARQHLELSAAITIGTVGMLES